MPEEGIYAAFISYSHEMDHELGPLLQEGIEKFGKPWYRPRSRRVFLDNSVLAAEHDLTEAILDGLAHADNFLLLASPASARSRWVSKEVEWWLENRDRRTLFVLLTSGEAVWDNGVLDQRRTTALPAALHDVPEPRCVDLRGVRDVELDPRNPDWESVLADVVAPLDGIAKTELIGHHIRERRRTRRTVLTTITVLVVLLIAAVIFAVRSEQQSDRAQRQAMVATSRQLVAQAVAIRDSRPNIARQLLAQAYRMSPTAEVLGALVESPSIPRVVPTGGETNALAFAPGGELLAVGTENDLLLVDGPTERARIPLGAKVLDVAFHPDGRHVVAATQHAMSVIEIADPSRRYVWQAGAGSLAFVPGKPVLVAGQALLDLTSPQAPRQIASIVPEGGVSGSVTVGADGTTVAVYEINTGMVGLWDISGMPFRRGALPKEVRGSVLFARKGALLAVREGETVQLWNAASGTLYSSFVAADLVGSMAFSPDGTMLATGDMSGRVSLWDVTDAIRPRAAGSLPGHVGNVTALAFRADSRVLASASVDGSPEQHVVRLWNVLAASRSTATAVVPQGGWELAFGVNHQLATGRPTTLYDLRDVVNPRKVRTFRTFNAGGQPVAFSPDGSRLAAGMPIVLMDPRSSGPPAVKQEESPAQVVFSPDGTLIGVSGDGDASLWTRQGEEVIRVAGFPGTISSAGNGISFDQDGRRAVTVGTGGETVRMWDIADPHRPRQIGVIDTKTDPVEAVLFGPGQNHVTAGTGSGLIAIWSVDGGRVATVSRHLGGVHNLALHPEGRMMASAAKSGEVVLWDLSDPSRPVEVSQLRSGERFNAASIAFSPDGTMLGGADGTRTTIWSTDVPRLLARLCADSPRIPEAEWRQYLPEIPYDPPCA